MPVDGHVQTSAHVVTSPFHMCKICTLRHNLVVEASKLQQQRPMYKGRRKTLNCLSSFQPFANQKGLILMSEHYQYLAIH
jgi:hypothetical protein